MVVIHIETWSFGIVFCKESHPKGLKHARQVNFSQPSRSVANDCSFYALFELATKKSFARVRSARGWGVAYQGSYNDPTHLSHTLDLTWKAPGS